MESVVDLSQGMTFFLMLMRVSGVIFLLPLFGDINVPSLIKIFLSIVLTFFFFNVFKVSPIGVDQVQTLELVAFVFKEFVIGMIIGYLFRMMFFVVVGASEAISQTSGFAASRLFNPQTQMQETVLTEIFFLLTVLVFFAVNGETLVLRVLHRLFSDIPLGHLNINENLIRAIVGTGSLVVQLAVRLAGPMLFCLVLINVGMGIAGRVIPSLNIIALSFTFTLGATLWLLWIFLPSYIGVIDNLFVVAEQMIFEIIGGMCG